MPLSNSERKKRYRERHPDRIAAYKERTKERRAIVDRAYREAHKDKIVELIRKWKQAHPGYNSVYQQRYRELHRDEIALKAREAYATKRYIRTMRSEDERFFDDIPPDEGCSLHSACLTCPFPDCKFDED